MTLSTPNILLFCSLISLLSLGQSQNTSFSFNVFTPHSERLTYERDAFVPPDEPYVRLAQKMSINSVGRVLYTSPVKLWEEGKQASFETTITLKITRLDTFRYSAGMTFFIVPVNSTKSTGGELENLGIYDAVKDGSPVFAVEIDISYLQGVLDPKYSHIGINFNSQRSQNTTRINGNSIFEQLVTMHITYDAPTRKINMVLTYGSGTSTVSYVLNLAALLPSQVQIGLSASSDRSFGAYFDAYTWKFNSTLLPDVNSVTRKDTTYIKQYAI